MDKAKCPNCGDILVISGLPVSCTCGKIELSYVHRYPHLIGEGILIEHKGEFKTIQELRDNAMH